tara:strand:- start:7155 stop:8036 length:882 start_codon:yes stop_codon:yes gene_type:complete
MALTITSSSYNGEHAGQYVAAALNAAKSLNFMTVLDNVNHKRVINKVAGAHLVKDSTCAFNETADGSNTSTLTLTEQVLFVEPFQINIDVCKKTMLADWSGKQEDDFVAYCMSYLADSIASSVETSIWQGATSTNGQFDKISATGMVAESSTGVGAQGFYGPAKIIGELGDLMAAVPSAVYGAEDLYIYMSARTYRDYISAISALSAFPFNHMGQYTPEFEGTKIAICPGIEDDVMYAGRKSNIFFGTSLQSDLTEIKVLDMENLDGSSNVRMVAKWTAGVQIGVPGDFVKQS